jgi:hypothetical protein
MRVLLALLILSSCNPVRKVLQDPAKFAVIKDTVLARGYCVNDTSFLYITDTLEVTDTLYEVMTDTLVINDSLVFWDTKYKTILKTRTIRDSIISVVVDSARVMVLRKELNLEREKAKENKSWKKMFFWAVGSAIAFFLLLFRLK